MAEILVAGGTGQAGAKVVKELLHRGHSVRVLTRHGGAPGTPIAHYPGDLITGEGLADALAGVDAVIDTTDGRTRATRPIFTDGARNLTRAAAEAGVRRAVLLSIVNVDRGDYAYYRAKFEQEQIYDSADLPTCIVRATQFHEFVPMIAAPTSRIGLLPALSGTRFQTIDLRDVARALVDAALSRGGVPNEPVVIGGPEVRTSKELTKAWKKASGKRGLVLEIPMPGKLGKFFREESNIVEEHKFGTITFEQWLADTVHG